MRTLHGRRLGAVIGGAAWVLSSSALAAVNPSAYDAAITRARRGDSAASIVQLKEWLAEAPTDQRIRRDLVVLANWGEEHALALQTFAALPASQPVYVLAAAALSARRLQQWALADSLYRQWLAIEPTNRDAQSGWVLSQLGAGKVAEASSSVESFLPSAGQPRRHAALAPLLEALASVREAQSRDTEALAAWQDLIAVAPTLLSARRAMLFVVSRLGATSIADELARDPALALEKGTALRLRQERTATAVRWGEDQLALDTGLTRFGWTNRSLIENAADRVVAPSGTSLEKNALFDRIVAARDRVAMNDVVTLYQHSERLKFALPAYARAAVADAFLYLREPVIARDLYLQALADYLAETKKLQPEWKFSLLYAYLENGEWQHVADTADEMVTYFNPLRQANTLVQRNEAGYARARLTQALSSLYGDQLSLAWERLQDFIVLAPHNVSGRAALASWFSANAMPRRSHEEFLRAHAEDPVFLGARLGMAETDFSLSRWQTAEAQSAQLTSEYPENRAIQRFADTIEARHAPELRLSGAIGWPLGEKLPTQAHRDWRIDAYGYSPPFLDKYRLFAHAFRSHADFVDRMARRERLGLGVERSAESISASVELHADTLPTSKVGVALALTYTPTDLWRIRGAIDTNTTDIALRATQAGVKAAQYSASVERRFVGLNTVAASVNHFRFSDGNERTAVAATWHQRWVSEPHYKFDSETSIGRSKNRLTAVPYFSPSADASADVTAILEWLTWREYERSFKQRLIGTLGSYWQQGYGNGAVLGVRYEHEWERARNYVLRYGAGWIRRPYDGREEQRLHLYFDLGWKLR